LGYDAGLNFIYVHLNRIISKYDLDMIYICGSGQTGGQHGKKLGRRGQQHGSKNFHAHEDPLPGYSKQPFGSPQTVLESRDCGFFRRRRRGA